ncbi:MAG: VanW family protein, partial [Paludibacteraceae bacterium]|nr:VanW family protein [Paludibacteraceae bacterium]
TTTGYGGGSCQVSSTLYNTVLQLPGITVTERHPHGSNGLDLIQIHIIEETGKVIVK